MDKSKKKVVKDPPINTHYRQLFIEIEPKYVGMLIGDDGKHFKRITDMARVKYIWWEESIKRIEIWGPERRLDLACNILKDHYIFIKKKYENNKNNIDKNNIDRNNI